MALIPGCKSFLGFFYQKSINQYLPPINSFYMLLFYTKFCTTNCLHTASYLLVVIKLQGGELDKLLLTVFHSSSKPLRLSNQTRQKLSGMFDGDFASCYYDFKVDGYPGKGKL